LTLAGCGGAAVATTAGGEASVEQYASLVAANASDWRERRDHPRQLRRLQRGRRLRGGLPRHQRAGRDAPHRLSEANQVSAEIATLVAETKATAGAYSAAFEAWQATNCANPIDFNCGADQAGAMFSALGNLTRQFDAWKAHTG
jgi:hypothetical protein